MNYFLGIGSVVLFHAGVSYALISASTGNGSFVGLGAMLFALIGIPVTAIALAMLIHAHRKNPNKGYIGRFLLFALALPVLQLALFILAAEFRW